MSASNNRITRHPWPFAQCPFFGWALCVYRKRSQYHKPTKKGRNYWESSIPSCQAAFPMVRSRRISTIYSCRWRKSSQHEVSYCDDLRHRVQIRPHCAGCLFRKPSFFLTYHSEFGVKCRAWSHSTMACSNRPSFSSNMIALV